MSPSVTLTSRCIRMHRRWTISCPITDLHRCRSAFSCLRPSGQAPPPPPPPRLTPIPPPQANLTPPHFWKTLLRPWRLTFPRPLQQRVLRKQADKDVAVSRRTPGLERQVPHEKGCWRAVSLNSAVLAGSHAVFEPTTFHSHHDEPLPPTLLLSTSLLSFPFVLSEYQSVKRFSHNSERRWNNRHPASV